MTLFKPKSCTCDSRDRISLSTRQASWILSCFVCMCFFIFIAGYFKGKKLCTRALCTNIAQESFADKVSSSVYSLYDASHDSGEDSDNNVSSEASQPLLSLTDSTQMDNGEIPSVNNNSILLEGHSSVEKKSYYAQLIGFGTQRAAELFVQKLHKNNIMVQVKKRTSTTARGKRVLWYQVVTDIYSNRDQLTALVQSIQKIERLHDIRIVSC